MKNRINRLLTNYDAADQELFLKAKFLLILTGIFISVLIVSLLYTGYAFGFYTITAITEMMGLAVMLTALFILIKGKYAFAVHILLSTSFAIVWIVMFIEPVTSLIVKLDTIVLIVGLMAALPLMFFTTRHLMVIYFLVNFIAFIGFNLYLIRVGHLDDKVHIDYALDNSIAIVCVFIISYMLSGIYHKVLQSLKRYRLFLSDLINSMPSVIIGINDQMNITIWNKGAEELTGLTEKDTINKKVFEILPEFRMFQNEIETVLTTETLVALHKKKFLFQDKGYMVDLDIYPLFEQDNSGAVIRMDDNSERLKMEEVIVQSEKMMSLGGLAAGMAHELNNPLAGMVQSAQVIQNRLTKDLAANTHAADEIGINMTDIRSFAKTRGIVKQLENIHSAGNHAAQVISNMLGFARKTDSIKEVNNITGILEDTIELMQNDFDLHSKKDINNIKIHKNYNPEENIPVFCEKSKLQQVFFNILQNASDAMAEYKEEAQPRINIEIFRTPGWIQLTIQDNGPGMDEATRKRIFEPFYTTKSNKDGTGLGLSVSYFIIVENHGGKLEVESSPHQGSRFIISLPDKA